MRRTAAADADEEEERSMPVPTELLGPTPWPARARAHRLVVFPRRFGRSIPPNPPASGVRPGPGVSV
ncbi:hypothetical protein M2164_001332 [Streptomyces sp. SAI-208]|uniref:hypothetical protein n=1 Tax=Streptomyces sp. SAI-208 TaxID=2940550 RepID=UPI002475D73E|nr:hypothetical protein [Streptomyces sp. SAI-208]MDH6605697.1 hypothetical protein [Streptomyces sp. SAI-208]